MAKEGIRQRIKRGKREAARQRLERQREFDERQARDREEWDREMTELRERARAKLALETPEEQFERQQEHQRRLESAHLRERLLLRYTLCVVGAVTTALVGGALVVIFGFVTHGPRGWQSSASRSPGWDGSRSRSGHRDTTATCCAAEG